MLSDKPHQWMNIHIKPIRTINRLNKCAATTPPKFFFDGWVRKVQYTVKK